MKYEDYTREERAHMIIHNQKKYMSLLTNEHYLLLADGAAKVGPYKEEEE